MHRKQSQHSSFFLLLCLFVVAGCMNRSFVNTSGTNVLDTSTIQIMNFPSRTQTSATISTLTPTFKPPISIKPTAIVITPDIPDLSHYTIDDLDLIEILGPYHAELNLNGLTTFTSKDEKNEFCMSTAIDTSPASKYPIPLILCLVYDQDPAFAQKKLLETKSKNISEGYNNLPYQGKIQFPEETWVLEKDGEILELGTASGPIEIYITMQSNPLFLETHAKFTDLNSAKAILLDIAALQFNRIKNRS
jgi:hypothetical protein